jgi:lipoprotein-releasing system ATP-binding protein
VGELVLPEVLRLAAVRKSFNIGLPTEVEVLHGIDLVLRRGEFCALIGPSGSGKSTLLNLIGLLDRPTSGRLWLAGEETGVLDDAALTALRGRSIGFVFQHHHLITAFTAAENVMMPLLLGRGRPAPGMRVTAERLLGQVGLAPWVDSPVNRLSGGQQQRVAIARALAMDPLLVLADEPTGNLDTKSADAAFALMRAVNQARGTTFLVVTHDPRLARRCDRIVEVVDGQVQSDRRVGSGEGRA